MHIADAEAVEQHLRRGLRAFAAPEPMTLTTWAEKHFYLSKESSYREGAWEAWPFQRAIMACMSNDDIREVNFIKSARVGYTKMILAAVMYYAHHKRRNQALWQPTDDDRDEFVKTELDPVLRDIDVMREVFPSYMARHKDNTLQQKKFLGSLLHLRGGKAAKNYRRISVDVAYLDELSAFDKDIEKEGDAVKLAAKRIEGATFPKMIAGSTPKLKGFCLIEARAEVADVRYEYHVACAHCGEHHAITWGGKDEPHGFKWVDNDPQTVGHLCPHCGVLQTQGEYLAAADTGYWRGDDGSMMDHAGVVYDPAGNVIAPPRHVSFHVWTAYSPVVTWSQLVREFMDAYEKSQKGDVSGLTTFWNATLGLTWEGEIERTDAEDLKNRAQTQGKFPLRIVPKDCLLLLAGADTQDNRIEVAVWGYGRGQQMWTIDHQVFFGNPAEDQVWTDVATYLFEQRFAHETGNELAIHGTAIDSGGHHSNAVYEFARRHKARRVFAVRGRPAGEKHIKDGAGQVDIDWRGKKAKKGVILWHVGTNLAKDLIYGRLQVDKPGPGFINLSHELSDEWFRQFSGEVRATRRTATGTQSRWTAIRKRVETLDCAVYAVWLETHLELSRKKDAWWDALHDKVHTELPDEAPKPRRPLVRAAPPPEPDTPEPPTHTPTQQPPPRQGRRMAASSYLRRR